MKPQAQDKHNEWTKQEKRPKHTDMVIFYIYHKLVWNQFEVYLLSPTYAKIQWRYHSPQCYTLAQAMNKDKHEQLLSPTRLHGYHCSITTYVFHSSSTKLSSNKECQKLHLHLF